MVTFSMDGEVLNHAILLKESIKEAVIDTIDTATHAFSVAAAAFDKELAAAKPLPLPRCLQDSVRDPCTFFAATTGAVLSQGAQCEKERQAGARGKPHQGTGD